MPLPLVAEQDFEREVIRSELPVLVDLYADWCAPCKQLEPILDRIAAELSGRVKVVRVDIEKSPMLAQAFRVQSIPMLVLIRDGRPVDQIIGLVDQATLMDMLRPHLPTPAGEIAPADLAPMIQQGRAVAVDVREAAAYARYRIPGAIHIPADELGGRLAELSPIDGRLRVIYGRSGDDGREAADKAREAGAQVGHLAGGFLHWEAEGLEVERGA